MNSLAIVCFALVGAVYGAPNHLKHVSVEKQVVVNSGGNLGASASWGPFSAGASLADGGASAGAVAPGAGAGAGIGSATASASASASAGSGSVSGGHGGPTIFDQIFNIPISVLKSVNDHLNTKETVPGAHAAAHAARRLRKCKRRGICPDEGVSVTTTHGTAGAGAGAGAQASASADASTHVHTRTAEADSSAGAQAGSGAQTVTVRKNYDNIFAIPISALTSVNQLLNGK